MATISTAWPDWPELLMFRPLWAGRGGAGHSVCPLRGDRVDLHLGGDERGQVPALFPPWGQLRFGDFWDILGASAAAATRLQRVGPGIGMDQAPRSGWALSRPQGVVGIRGRAGHPLSPCSVARHCQAVGSSVPTRSSADGETEALRGGGQPRTTGHPGAGGRTKAGPSTQSPSR